MSLELATRPASLVAVIDQCEAVEAWAESCDSVAELRDASHKLGAIDEYLKRSSVEGRGRVAATLRRLEIRIGKLLGPAVTGRPPESSLADDVSADLSRNERSQFRQMAENEEEVEAVIADSTDDKPASRRSVMDRIKAARGNHPIEPPAPNSRAAVAARVAKAQQMAAEGYTSRQIADALGISTAGMGNFKARHGLEVPADAITGRTHLHDSNRIVNETVDMLAGAVMGLALVDLAAVDRARADDWATSLNDSLRTLSKFHKKLKEMTQ